MTTAAEVRVLNRAGAENMEPGMLRSVLLALFDIEEKGDQIGWDEVRPVVFQYLYYPKENLKAAVQPLGMGNGYPWQMLERVVSTMEQAPSHMLANFASPDTEPAGCGLIYEAWVFGGPLQERLNYPAEFSLADVPSSIETRFVKAALPDGTPVVVCRPRDREPRAVVGIADMGSDERAADSFNISLARLNEVLRQAHDLAPVSNQEQSLGFPVVPIRWCTSEPRQQRVFPALDNEHPHREHACMTGCSQPLGNDTPVQLYVLGPLPDSEEIELCRTGQWHIAEAVLVHHHCIDRMEDVVETLTKTSPTL